LSTLFWMLLPEPPSKYIPAPPKPPVNVLRVIVLEADCPVR